VRPAAAFGKGKAKAAGQKGRKGAGKAGKKGAWPEASRSSSRSSSRSKGRASGYSDKRVVKQEQPETVLKTRIDDKLEKLGEKLAEKLGYGDAKKQKTNVTVKEVEQPAKREAAAREESAKKVQEALPQPSGDANEMDIGNLAAELYRRLGNKSAVKLLNCTSRAQGCCLGTAEDSMLVEEVTSLNAKAADLSSFRLLQLEGEHFTKALYCTSCAAIIQLSWSTEASAPSADVSGYQ